MNILQILDEIGADTKRSHKIDLIKLHKDNTLFMRVVKMALDPYVNFYIKKIPDYDPKGGQTLEWALDELEKLSSRTYTGHDGIEHLRNILSSISYDDAIVVSRIIGRDLRCGMADGIVNAVIENYIPTYPCLLARPYDAKNIKNINWPAYSQLKADGLRANAIVNGNAVSLFGRSGRPIDLLGHLDEDLIKLASKFPGPVVFDGEFVVVDETGKVIDRKTGNGIINKAIKGTIGDDEASLIRFQIWDVIPLDEFKSGKSTAQYKDRFESLLEATKNTSVETEDATVRKLQGKPSKYWSIPHIVVESLEEAELHFQELLSQGHEGTILKNYHAIWEDSRSKHLVKMKAEKDCDLEIIGWNPGTGKFEGMVGSLICASSDRLVEVSISGFSDDLRKEITDTIEDLIGKIVTITYNERIKSKARTGVDSLFLPRFAEFRSDKISANSSAEIT